jgi:hypothetical protein
VDDVTGRWWNASVGQCWEKKRGRYPFPFLHQKKGDATLFLCYPFLLKLTTTSTGLFMAFGAAHPPEGLIAW